MDGGAYIHNSCYKIVALPLKSVFCVYPVRSLKRQQQLVDMLFFEGGVGWQHKKYIQSLIFFIILHLKVKIKYLNHRTAYLEPFFQKLFPALSQHRSAQLKGFIFVQFTLKK